MCFVEVSNSESLRSETRAEHLVSNSIEAYSMEEMVDFRYIREEILLVDAATGELLGVHALLAFVENILSIRTRTCFTLCRLSSFCSRPLMCFVEISNSESLRSETRAEHLISNSIEAYSME
ncbi:hypothetical protein DY000_02008008 [Brassica cretica]|uniref:CBS domain-containing protein n=1 Tax=Brassica cretica TaxID=69181 RepID=A0ABQ7BY39_BRACR|nr:hypothetical protein DY000_02008008 [Brassica cretica]